MCLRDGHGDGTMPLTIAGAVDAASSPAQTRRPLGRGAHSPEARAWPGGRGPGLSPRPPTSPEKVPGSATLGPPQSAGRRVTAVG